MNVTFANDQMRARSGHVAHILTVLKHITLNRIRLDPIKRNGASRRAGSSPLLQHLSLSVARLGLSFTRLPWPPQ
jgi:hypothetical protein